MADFAHSLQRTQPSATVSKKISNGNSFTAKNAYDDVFGGSTKFGLPTFSSRVEDYSEIFSSYHSKRSSSIPILDLPVVDETDFAIDVRSSKFDYSEIFGGFDSVDFAVPYEELFVESKEGESSSEDVWTPAETGSPSEEASEDPACSESNREFKKMESHHAYDGVKQFNMSYQKTNQMSEDDGISATTHIAQLNAVPAFTVVVDENILLKMEKCDYPLPEVANDNSLNGNITDEIMLGKHLSETMPKQPASDTVSKTSGSDHKPQIKPDANGTYREKAFVTVSEINLRTQPSQLPPPSRLPPNLTIKQGQSKKLMASNFSSSTNFAHEGTPSGSSPPFFDVEVDASSSAAASAAAMKEAMEKAQARLKSAKESMERKKDGLQYRKKFGMKEDLKGKERREGEVAHDAFRSKEEFHEEIRREDTDLKGSDRVERQKAMGVVQLAPDFEVKGRLLNVSKGSVDQKHAKEGRLTQESLKREEDAGEWKAEERFYELVKKDTAGTVLVALEQRKRERMSMPTTTAKVGYEQQGKSDKQLQTAKRACQDDENGKKHDVDKEARKREREEKIKTAQDIFDLEEDVKKLKEAREREEHEEKQKEIREQEEYDKKKEAHEREEYEKMLKEAQEWEEHERKLKEACEREEYEKQQKEACQREDDVRRQKEAHEREENEKKQRVARQREENERLKKEAHERDENVKKQEEARQREENEMREKEAREREENEKKWKVAHQREENERLEKEAREREENEKKQKEARQREEHERLEKEACEREENEKKQKEALQREENERLEREAREREENEKKQKETRQREENERRQKEVRQREENEKKLEDSCERGENEKRLKQDCENSERRLKEVHEQEENEKILKEANEQEGNEKSLKEPCEQEVNEKLLQKEACERVENEKKLKELRQWEENQMRQEDPCKRKENENKLKEASEQGGIGNKHKEAKKEENNLKEETVIQESAECEKKLKGINDTCLEDEGNNSKATCGARKQEEHNKKLNIDQELCTHEEYGKTMKTAQHAFEHKENEKDVKAAEVANEQDKNERLRTACMAQSSPEHEECDIKKKAAPKAKLNDSEKNLGKIEESVGQEKDENCMKAEIVLLDCKDGKSSKKAVQEVRHWVENGKKMEAIQLRNEEEKGTKPKIVDEFNINHHKERKEKNLNGTLIMDDREKERWILKEREQEMERLRKVEEDREREREKDRMAVERATREVRERAYAEARERAERAAVERATAEARQRAMTEARERLERACAEAREKSLAEKASMEARLRAERAAVERATAEARERAVEKAMAEKAAMGARERVDRSVSEKFSATSRNNGMRQSASFSDLRDTQFQSSSSLSNSQRYPNSLNRGAVATGKSQEAEVESAQRCKARLERHQRTVERAAKALAEKNLRDHLAHREQAERNRLADTLDADVRRWSSGKEGNLRALLSTLQYILGPESGWQPIPLTDVITAVAVKKAYRKATLSVHPDKLQQRGASIQQKYICEKVFDLLKEAWNKFNSEER